MGILHVVYVAYIITQLECEMPITEYITQESMTLDIYLEYTLEIHKLYIIDKKYCTMYDDNCCATYDDNPPKKINYIQYELYKNIVNRDEDDREDNIITKIRRKYSTVWIKYPYEESYRNQEKNESKCHEYEHDTVTSDDEIRNIHRKYIIKYDPNKMLLMWLQK